MYVTAIQLYLTLTLGIFGISPAWCESCGEMYPEETLAWCEYDDGTAGYTCLECVEHWHE